MEKDFSLHYNDNLIVLDGHLIYAQPTLVGQAGAGEQVELPAMPGAGQDLALAAPNPFAGSRWECRATQATEAYESELVRTDVQHGYVAALKVENAYRSPVQLDDRFGLRGTWINFAELYRREGDYVRAEQCIEKSTSISRDLGLHEHMGYNIYFMGLLALHRNDYSSAAVCFRKYFDCDRLLEAKISLCRFITSMSAVAGGIDQPERCAKLFGAAQRLLESTSDFRMDPFDRAEFDRHIQIARHRLGNVTFEVLSAEGHRLTREQAIKLATQNIEE